MKKFMVAFAIVMAMVSMTGCGSNYHVANDAAQIYCNTDADNYEVCWTDKEGEKQSVRFEEEDDARDFAMNSLNAHSICTSYL